MGEDCTKDEDCFADYYCHPEAQQCWFTGGCYDSTECPSGLTCVYGACQDLDLWLSHCQVDDDCGTYELSCQENLCWKTNCDKTSCPSGEMCYYGEGCYPNLGPGDWCYQYDEMCKENLTCDYCSETCLFKDCINDWDCPTAAEVCRVGKCKPNNGMLG